MSPGGAATALLSLLVLPALALGCGGPRGAEAAGSSLTLTADARETGYIRLTLGARPGLAVTIEEAGRPLAQLTPGRERTVLRRVTPWSCETRTRSFVATGSDGSTAAASVRTPSCRRRLVLRAPRRVRASARVPLRLVDRWGIGRIEPRLCVEPPGGPARCRRERIRPGRRTEATRFRARRPGGWRVSARTRYGEASRPVRATRSGPLRLLATGDSMIQIIDSYLKQRLAPRGVRVRSDAEISTGISKPSLLNWDSEAKRQAAAAPDVVVMFLGANDGFPMGDEPCCGEAWIAEYARRARRMMKAYGRGGRTRVYWLLLPTPRGGFFRETFPAVNAGIRRAAARARRDVRVIDLVELFTPGGRYRDSMEIGGRNVRVRQSDGVHLNTAGASLAASVIIRTLRRERIVR